MKNIAITIILILSIQASFAQLTFTLDTIFLQNTFTSKLSLSPTNHCWSINQQDSSEIYEINNLDAIHNHTSTIQAVTPAKFSDLVAVDSGVTFIGTYGDYLIKYKSNSFTKLDTNNGLSNSKINSLVWAKKTKTFAVMNVYPFSTAVIMGTNRGLYYSNDYTKIKKDLQTIDSLSVVHYCNIEAISFVLTFDRHGNACYPPMSGSYLRMEYSSSGTYYKNFIDSDNLNDDSVNTFVNIMPLSFASAPGYGNAYWGTKKGFFASNFGCSGSFHKLNNIPVYKIYELRYFPYEKYHDNPGQLSYLLIGTENGLYFKYDPWGGIFVNDSIHFVPETIGYKIYDIDVDTCNSRVWLATDKGIVRLLLNNASSSHPNLKDLYSPNSDQLLCSGHPITLLAKSYQGFNYQWQKDNTNIPGATNPKYAASIPGKYRVVYNFSDGCRSYSDTSDPIKISLDTTVCNVTFADTIKLCEGATTLLNSRCIQSLNTYQWYKNGSLLSSENNSTYTASDSGYYTVKVYNCNNYSKLSDSVYVRYTIIPKPQPLVVPGEILCEGDSVRISVPFTNYMIKWYKGSLEITSNRNQLFYKTQFNGDYTVTYLKNNCSNSSDMIRMHFNTVSRVKINASKPLPLCLGDAIKLTANNQSNNYHWSNGETSKTISVSNASVYKVNSIDLNNCKSSDSLKVTTIPKPTPDLGKDTVFCEGLRIPILLQLPAIYKSYYWNGIQSNNSYEAYTEGQFIVSVTDYNNCNNADTIHIYNSCPDIFIPNLFTPNNDGNNDVFFIKGLLPACTLRVYNRYGQAVYINTTYDNSWNGSGLGDGVYFYDFISNYHKKTWKGWVEIVRE